MTDQGERFLLADEQDAFKEKAGNLFNALNDVHYSPSQETDSFLKKDPSKDDSQSARLSRANLTRGQRNKHNGRSGSLGNSSIMPPPRAPPLKRRQSHPIPDHVRHPSKYTKYSLADVPESQLSQRSNTAAAFEFLREVEKRQQKEEIEDKECDGARPLFKKPARKGPKSAEKGKLEHQSGSSGVSSGIARSEPKRDAIKLSHLEYEDEE